MHPGDKLIKFSHQSVRKQFLFISFTPENFFCIVHLFYFDVVHLSLMKANTKRYIVTIYQFNDIQSFITFFHVLKCHYERIFYSENSIKFYKVFTTIPSCWILNKILAAI